MVVAHTPSRYRATDHRARDRLGVWDTIRDGIFDLDGVLTKAEHCDGALSKLIEYVPNEHGLRETMFSLQGDLDTALVKARHIFSDLHKAIGGSG